MKPCGGYSNNSKAAVTAVGPRGQGMGKVSSAQKKKSCGGGGDIKICTEAGLRDQIYYVDKVYCLKGEGTIILLNEILLNFPVPNIEHDNHHRFLYIIIIVS
jgi:hypothetical protein